LRAEQLLLIVTPMAKFRRYMISIPVLTASVLVCPPTVAAQTEGRVGVGGSVTFVAPTSDNVGKVVGFGPIVRLNPKRGWGPAGALNWFRADLDNPTGGDAAFATLRVRHLMGGIAYSLGPDRTLVSFSLVAGPSFNSVDFEEEYLATQPGNPEIDVDTSFAIRPGVSLTQTLSPRVGLVGFAGYLFNRPGVTYRSASGQQFEDEWRADAFVLSVGVVYSLF
jgi:hypothetical protein